MTPSTRHIPGIQSSAGNILHRFLNEAQQHGLTFDSTCHTCQTYLTSRILFAIVTMIVYGLIFAVFTVVPGVYLHAPNAQTPRLVYPDGVHDNFAFHCPVLNCPQWCARFRGQNGCLYCGPCNSYQRMCPLVKCPNRPDAKCGIVVGLDGCKQCVCQNRLQLVDRVQPMYNSAPNNRENYPEAPNCPTPQCSENCRVVSDERGCGHCKCFPPVCPSLSCPPNCNKYRGVDGCVQCDCGEVAACPPVPCDLSRCRHAVDGVSGCAVSCECNNIPAMSQSGYGK